VAEAIPRVAVEANDSSNSSHQWEAGAAKSWLQVEVAAAAKRLLLFWLVRRHHQQPPAFCLPIPP